MLLLRSPAASYAWGPPPHPRPLPTAARGEGRRKTPRRRCTQFHQRRQEPGQRLAGARRRDQQRRAVVAGFSEQIKLMFARRPAARREPFLEAVGQQRVGFVRNSGQNIGRHGSRRKPLRRFGRGWRRKSPLPAWGYRMHTSLRTSFGARENASLFNIGGCPQRLPPSTSRVI